jgi:hypothetical protein
VPPDGSIDNFDIISFRFGLGRKKPMGPLIDFPVQGWIILRSYDVYGAQMGVSSTSFTYTPDWKRNLNVPHNMQELAAPHTGAAKLKFTCVWERLNKRGNELKYDVCLLTDVITTTRTSKIKSLEEMQAI